MTDLQILDKPQSESLSNAMCKRYCFNYWTSPFIIYSIQGIWRNCRIHKMCNVTLEKLIWKDCNGLLWIILRHIWFTEKLNLEAKVCRYESWATTHCKKSVNPVSPENVKFQFEILAILNLYEWQYYQYFHLHTVAYRGGWFGGFKPLPKFRRYRWSPRSHEQEEPASRFPFAIHCVLIRL